MNWTVEMMVQHYTLVPGEQFFKSLYWGRLVNAGGLDSPDLLKKHLERE
jgi:hypothetical protein